VRRRSSSWIQGIVDVFDGLGGCRRETEVHERAVWPVPTLRSRVYGRPLANRNRRKAPSRADDRAQRARLEVVREREGQRTDDGVRPVVVSGKDGLRRSDRSPNTAVVDGPACLR